MASAFMGAAKALQAQMGDNKPMTAVTDWIDRLCSARYEEEDLDGVAELVQSINLQTTGPTEASRAIRKKLKYGSVPQQLRALTILKALVENCGPRFQSTFSDERLVDRIKVIAADPNTDTRVKKKLLAVVASWHRQFKDDPRFALVAGLYHQLEPVRNNAYKEQQRRAEAEERLRQERKRSERAAEQARLDAERAAREEAKRRAKQKPGQRRPPFNFEAEKPKIMIAIASLTQSSQSLINAVQHVDRQKELVSENPIARAALEKLKADRKVVIRYVQLVPEVDKTGEYISPLISTNELAISALRAYDAALKPAEHDSDDEPPETTPAGGRLPLGPSGELDRIQERQRAEVERASARGAPMSPSSMISSPSSSHAFDDLADLDFSLSSASSSLPAPIKPKRADEEHYDPGTLSDFSDFDSEDERAAHRPGPSYHRGPGLLSQAAEEDAADPFADPDDEVSTPGIGRKRVEWAEI